MVLTTGLFSVSVEVEDHDRAIAFYRDALGCEVVFDEMLWGRSRFVEVKTPGSEVRVALVTPKSQIPIGVRYWTDDAEATHAALVDGGTIPNSEVLRLEGAPPMFTFDDPDGNTVIVLEGPPRA